jgi:hypothetical protein
MIETRRGQPIRPVGPGNDSGEARVSLNDPQTNASVGDADGARARTSRGNSRRGGMPAARYGTLASHDEWYELRHPQLASR